MNYYKIRFILIYLIVAEVISCFLAYRYHLNEELIGMYLMILPSTSIVLLKYSSKNEKLLVYDYIIYAYFMIFNICIIACLFMKYYGVNSQKFINEFLINLGGIASIGILINSFINNNEKDYKLDIFKNLRKCMYYLFCFLFILMILIILLRLNYYDALKMIVVGFFSIVSVNILFLGEEYCWRGYLQEMLQQKFGKRCGIVILSLIWETWHIPLWYSYYKVDFIGNIFRYFYVLALSIIIGYVYMKTKNLWICAMMHLMNNSIASAIGGIEVNKETLFATSNLGFLIIILTTISIVILTMKEFRDT